MPATSKESHPRTKQSKKRSERDRRECIKRKTMELATLCDVKACAIIFRPDGLVETWPENQAEVKSLVKAFKHCVEESSNKKAPPEPTRENLDDLKGKETEQDDNSRDFESEIEGVNKRIKFLEEGNRAMAKDIESFEKVAGEQNRVKGKAKEIQPPNPVRSVDGTSGSFY